MLTEQEGLLCVKPGTGTHQIEYKGVKRIGDW